MIYKKNLGGVLPRSQGLAEIEASPKSRAEDMKRGNEMKATKIKRGEYEIITAKGAVRVWKDIDSSDWGITWADGDVEILWKTKKAAIRIVEMANA